MRALVYGSGYALFETAVPSILSRAGFDVTVILKARRLRACVNAKRTLVLPSPREVVSTALTEIRANRYDLVIAGDEDILIEVATSQLTVADKLLLLPVISENSFVHLGSKIGLSCTLQKAGVPSPAFAIARNDAELREAIDRIGAPVLLKADRGGGGAGVSEPLPDGAKPSGLSFPLVVQKKLDGAVIDVSAFFYKEDPVCFSYSRFVRSKPEPFGLSVARLYYPAMQQDPAVERQLRQLGKALGANGFCNITAIQTANDDTLHFIEADLRANVWTEYPRYFGHDPANCIRAFFSGEKSLTQSEKSDGRPILMGYMPRLSLFDILTNRYGCRTYYANPCHRHVTLNKLFRPVGMRLMKHLRWLLAKSQTVPR